jgi:hypothetical protein
MLLSFARSDDKVDDNKRGRRETTTDGTRDKSERFSRLQTFYDQLHMGCAELQNRRLQVRFLSHLPEKPEFMGLQS